MQNFEKHFAVVGVTEHFNKSMEVFEAFLPKYFLGANALLEEEPSILHTNQNTFKPKVDGHIQAAVAANMTKEIEFYHIVKQRLFQQHAAIF